MRNRCSHSFAEAKSATPGSDGHVLKFGGKERGCPRRHENHTCNRARAEGRANNPRKWSGHLVVKFDHFDDVPRSAERAVEIAGAVAACKMPDRTIGWGSENACREAVRIPVPDCHREPTGSGRCGCCHPHAKRRTIPHWRRRQVALNAVHRREDQSDIRRRLKPQRSVPDLEKRRQHAAPARAGALADALSHRPALVLRARQQEPLWPFRHAPPPCRSAALPLHTDDRNREWR